MRNKELYKLVDKYFAGETNVSEEIILKESVSMHDVPDDLKYLRSIFSYFEEEAEQIELERKPEKTRKLRKRNLYVDFLVAASISLLVITSVIIPFLRNERNNTYAYIDGVKTTDYNQVRQCAIYSFNLVKTSDSDIEGQLSIFLKDNN